MAEKISAGGVKKGRNEGEKVITANRLLDGAVVYFGVNHRWTEYMSEATVIEGDGALVMLAVAVADEASVVGPYLMDVATDGGVVVPDGRGALREAIRARGPTIHPQFARHGARQSTRRAA